MKQDLFYKTQLKNFSDVAETLKVIEKKAAANIHFLKKRVEVLREYRNNLQVILRRFSLFYSRFDEFLPEETQGGKRRKKVLLILTGERGLVGGLYHQLVQRVLLEKNDYQEFWVLGARGRDYLLQEKIKAEEPFRGIFLEEIPKTEEIWKATNYVFQKFKNSEIQKIDILYPRFFSLLEQKPEIIQFLPFLFGSLNIVNEKKEDDPKQKEQIGLPVFESSKKTIFNEIFKRYLGIALGSLLLESKLSEFSARTVLAESAVKQTEDLIRLFKRRFLKIHHLLITQKQLESFVVHQLTTLKNEQFS